MEIFWDRGGGICIGNNVFIGMKTTILKGVHIGDNVIIGANSLVNKDVPNNCVVAGNPARVIMSLDKYHEKRKALQLQEAEEIVKLYSFLFSFLFSVLKIGFVHFIHDAVHILRGQLSAGK